MQSRPTRCSGRRASAIASGDNSFSAPVLGGSTISDGKSGWGATRGYPHLTPRHPAHRLFEIAPLDAISSLLSHSDLLRQMERAPISSRAIAGGPSRGTYQ